LDGEADGDTEGDLDGDTLADGEVDGPTSAILPHEPPIENKTSFRVESYTMAPSLSAVAAGRSAVANLGNWKYLSLS
jgi:hypothetical protein